MNTVSSPVATTHPKLDYGLVSQPITKADYESFSVKYKGKGMKLQLQTIIVTSVIALIFVIVFLLVLTPIVNELNLAGMFSLIFSVLVLATIVCVVYIASDHYKKKLVKLDRLASQNGLTFVFDQPDPPYKGMIFDEGHSRVLNQAFVFPSGLEIGNYTYVTGNGKNSQTHMYGFSKVPLPHKLPHMVLDAQQNNFFGLSNLPDFYNRSQVLSLEGDFDKHFKLYAPKQYERDALYVFTPDVMACLIDSGKNYDMEVIDDSLYLYKTSHHDLLSAPQVDALLQIIVKIANEIRKQTGQYMDERVPKGVVNEVAPAGKRLKPGVNYVMIAFVAIATAYYASGVIWPESALSIQLVAGAVFWSVALVFIIIMKTKRR